MTSSVVKEMSIIVTGLVDLGDGEPRPFSMAFDPEEFDHAEAEEEASIIMETAGEVVALDSRMDDAEALKKMNARMQLAPCIGVE